MPRPARYEFIGGPLDTETLDVPMGLDGGPAGEVYVELTPPPSGSAPGASHAYPKISPAGFTGHWVAYRLKVDPVNALKSTYVLAEGEESDQGKEVMKANLSRFLHGRD